MHAVNFLPHDLSHTFCHINKCCREVTSHKYPNSHALIFISFLQVMGIVFEHFFYVCDSKNRDIALGVLYGYKAALQIVAFIFTFSIRKVRVKGLNDAKYIAAAVYVTSIVTAVIIVSLYSLKTFLNLYAALFGLGFLIGTTVILALVFVPKVTSQQLVCSIYSDSTGFHLVVGGGGNRRGKIPTPKRKN